MSNLFRKTLSILCALALLCFCVTGVFAEEDMGFEPEEPETVDETLYDEEDDYPDDDDLSDDFLLTEPSGNEASSDEDFLNNSTEDNPQDDDGYDPTLSGTDQRNLNEDIEQTDDYIDGYIEPGEIDDTIEAGCTEEDNIEDNSTRDDSTGRDSSGTDNKEDVDNKNSDEVIDPDEKKTKESNKKDENSSRVDSETDIESNSSKSNSENDDSKEKTKNETADKAGKQSADTDDDNETDVNLSDDQGKQKSAGSKEDTGKKKEKTDTEEDDPVDDDMPKTDEKDKQEPDNEYTTEPNDGSEPVYEVRTTPVKETEPKPTSTPEPPKPTPTEKTTPEITEGPWDCPKCGRTGNMGNFCGSCAHPAPWVLSAVTIIDRSVKAGDYVKFGRCEQDDDLSNGTEEIEWIVLDVQEGKCLLLSKYGLDARAYDSESKENNQAPTWETCALRNWLNNDFFMMSFTTEERSAILETNNGNDILDQIFLLSDTEAGNYLNVTYDDKDNVAARTAPTDYAASNGAVFTKKDKTTDGDAAGWWWLRTVQKDQQVNEVCSNGSLSSESFFDENRLVRPAFWLNLESDIFK